MIKQFLKSISGLNFIDIGSSGSLDPKWKYLEPYINLVGFDPNAEECVRMSNLPNNFRSLKYLPHAVGGDAEKHILYKTRSIFCYSLLVPNSKWLNRFSFSDLFEITGEEIIETVKLSDVEEIRAFDVDIIKVDTQGLELPILSNSGDAFEKAFFIETETGFSENYLGETTFSQVDEYMRSKGFLLFDMNIAHRIPRNNVFKNTITGSEQLMWCEATWLKDYIQIYNEKKFGEKTINREKALKILILCALQGCIDYGYELALLFNQFNLINKFELENLSEKKSWLLINDLPLKNAKISILNLALRLLPTRTRLKIRDQAELAVTQKHLFKF
jgi:hypothetical protein